MGEKVLSSVSAAVLLTLVAGSAHAQDAVCSAPVEIAGFRTCADVTKAEQEGKLVIYSTGVEQGQAKIVAAFSASFPKIKPAYVRAGKLAGHRRRKAENAV